MVRSRPSLEGLAAGCRARGLPLTIQRRSILEVLLAREDHPTADDVAEALAQRVEGISRATVYRTLETLVEIGLITRVAHPAVAVRYEIRADRHHHLVCDRCGAMSDFDEPRLDALSLPDFASAGFRVRDYTIQVRGVCRRCTRGAAKRPKTKKE